MQIGRFHCTQTNKFCMHPKFFFAKSSHQDIICNHKPVLRTSCQKGPSFRITCQSDKQMNLVLQQQIKACSNVCEDSEVIIPLQKGSSRADI